MLSVIIECLGCPARKARHTSWMVAPACWVTEWAHFRGGCSRGNKGPDTMEFWSRRQFSRCPELKRHQGSEILLDLPHAGPWNNAGVTSVRCDRAFCQKWIIIFLLLVELLHHFLLHSWSWPEIRLSVVFTHHHVRKRRKVEWQGGIRRSPCFEHLYVLAPDLRR